MLNLREFQEKLSNREALETELNCLHEQANELSARLRRERLNLEYEQFDVEALEKNTLKSFFYTAIGKKEERLIKEEDEAEDALRQYEKTQQELARINESAKRVENELQKLQRAEHDYKLFVEKLTSKIKEIEPRLTDEDALALEQIQRGLSKQAQKQALYAKITEEGKTLQASLAWVEEAQREAHEAVEMIDSSHTLPREYYERMEEAQARRQTAEIQAQRIQDLLRGINGGSNAYGAQTEHSGTLPKDLLLRLSGNVVGNIAGILGEVEDRMQRSKCYQAELEMRLFELLQKYEA
jgi:chromosome segregation ATPase